MTADRFRRVEEVFRLVSAAEPASRFALLDSACGDDPALRREVEELLAADAAPPSFVRETAVGSFAARNAAEAMSEEGVAVPERIGGYRVLGVIGAGGMGVVYRAAQSNPAREVALKVLRPGSVGSGAARRFEHEARLLARLDHPAIAQVFEAGTWTEGGARRPWFAMELVRGLPVTEFARGRALSPQARLEMFALICDGVQHAHQKGVIHRDLKPGNILVAEGDGGAPRPKILDFGVARLMEADRQVTALHTAAGEVIGTLPYMSPEQVAGRPDDVDTRADVYALGVILYELMCGVRPIDVDGLGIAAAARRIADEEPVRLGTRDRALRGDVEAIAARTLEKDPARRYQSAGELAEDVRRYLRHEPVAARRPGPAYQFRKFARRNRALVAGASLAAASLAAGTAFSSWMAWREHRAGERAAANAAAATRQAERADRVKQLLIGMFAPVYPRRPAAKVTVEHMLGQAVERVRAELGGQSDIADEMQLVLATIYLNLDLPRQGAPLLEDLLARQKAAGVPPAVYAATLDRLADAYNTDRDYVRSAACHRELLEIRRSTERPDSIAAINALNGLAHTLTFGGRAEEGVRLRREALAWLDGLPEDRPSQRFASTLGLGTALMMSGRDAEAESLFRAILADPRYASEFWSRYYLALVLVNAGETGEALRLLEPMVPGMRARREGEPRRLGILLTLYSAALEESGEYDRAEAAAGEAIEVLAGIDAAKTPAALKQLASTLYRRRQHGEALGALDRALEEIRRVRPDPALEALTHALRARVLAETGNGVAAGEAAGQSLDLAREAWPPGHPAIARALRDVAYVERCAGRPDAAVSSLREALVLVADTRPPGHKERTQIEEDLARALMSAGRREEALGLLEDMVSTRTAALGPQHPCTGSAMALRDELANPERLGG